MAFAAALQELCTQTDGRLGLSRLPVSNLDILDSIGVTKNRPPVSHPLHEIPGQNKLPPCKL
jgi:hypothetical protein